uniref:Uncharacterized protein n=2 Tax=environmental samples TaxID=68359 RepID=A0A075HNR9_9EURY|nr:hypothetical protein [uncultured marine group II/III euryarchaeote KM3_187_D06]AIF18061.1 hypothetical protein [uncultured marine group II/III euryarchaeote KM3_80_H04]
MSNSNETPAFHTFTLIRGDICESYISALEQAADGDDSDLISLIKSDNELSQILEDEGCNIHDGREGCEKSDSSLLLVGLTPLDSSGQRVRDSGDSKVRDRLGRYPWGDGNPLSYLRTWSGNPPDSEQDVMILIDKLDEGLFEKSRGHDRFENSTFGTLHGILDHDETVLLEKLLRGGHFKVRADEPLDGGVADIMRHLKNVVRSAARQGMGLLHFSH